MSNRSRARQRVDPPEAPDPAEVERGKAAAAAFEAAGTKQGLSRWVGLMLAERKRQLEPDAGMATVGDAVAAGEIDAATEPVGLREPTPYERAMLFAMGDKPMYGGTVEPWRRDQRRRRNKAARAARRINRRAAR